MENLSREVVNDMDTEEFSDEFQCCVCLDLMYKPVVLACGHISCFWCVFNAMDTYQESHCPVCRNPYNHFPSICQLLHFLLLKVYPSAYKRRERQVAEEEKKYGSASPQFDENLLDPHNNKVLDFQDSSSPLPGVATIESNSISSVQKSLKRTFNDEDNKTDITTSTNMVESKDTNETCKKVLVSDLRCAVCQELLYHPVVLNCGHVYCETCISTPNDNVCRCPLCQCAHPNGFPNVCLVLDHFVENYFPREYSARKESLPKSSRSSKENQEGTQCSSAPKNIYSSLSSGHGANSHPGVGCDYCGMCPIIGKRYSCKDCVEKIGFDLCEGCYNSSSKLPGRFNQQHTQEHKFKVISPSSLQNVILSLGAELSQEYGVDGVSNMDNPIYVSSDASEEEEEDENDMESSSDHSQEQNGDSQM